MHIATCGLRESIQSRAGYLVSPNLSLDMGDSPFDHDEKPPASDADVRESIGESRPSRTRLVVRLARQTVAPNWKRLAMDFGETALYVTLVLLFFEFTGVCA